MVLAEGTVITSEDLGLDAASETESFLTLKQMREKTERSAIMQALELSRNNVSAASKLLGVSRPTLYDLMKSLNLRT
jgi:two-component system NtrC family response regulator